jgi:ATP-dependent RNA helicase SUPV3L1/SUV3
VHDYGRLSRLKTEDYTMSSWSELRTGDCIIGFNIRRLHAMKDEINAFMNTNEEGDVISADNHCALLYGALPPESKIKQVESFNER